MSKFQIIVIGILVAGAVLAMLIFTGVIPGFKSKQQIIKEKITIWGIFPENEALDKILINYQGKNPETYKEEIIDAMASGNPPDIIFLTQDMLLEFKDKIQVIPFESFSERDFRDTFIEPANLFIDYENQGIFAFPCIIDPLVLYWNRDLFSSSGAAQVPKYWVDFVSTAPLLTKFDNAKNLIQAGVAMGEFDNVKNAKEIISMMILQTNNSLVDPKTLKVVWNERREQPESPIESAVRFFNEFSNPKKTTYSWNRSLKNSNEMFSFGSLAMYFGYAGEFHGIKERNPHLNFDVALVPQIKPASQTDAGFKATFGKIYALAISKNSPNKQQAFSFILKLTGKELNKQLADNLFLTPGRRDVLAEGSADTALNVFYKAGIMARSWLEPNPQQVSEIFENMVELSSSGKKKISEVVGDATKELEGLLK